MQRRDFATSKAQRQSQLVLPESGATAKQISICDRTETPLGAEDLTALAYRFI